MTETVYFGDRLLEDVQTRENALVELFGGYADIHVTTGPQMGVEVTIRHTAKDGEKTEVSQYLDRKDMRCHYQAETTAFLRQTFLHMRKVLFNAKQRKEAA